MSGTRGPGHVCQRHREHLLERRGPQVSVRAPACRRLMSRRLSTRRLSLAWTRRRWPGVRRGPPRRSPRPAAQRGDGGPAGGERGAQVVADGGQQRGTHPVGGLRPARPRRRPRPAGPRSTAAPTCAAKAASTRRSEAGSAAAPQGEDAGPRASGAVDGPPRPSVVLGVRSRLRSTSSAGLHAEGLPRTLQQCRDRLARRAGCCRPGRTGSRPRRWPGRAAGQPQGAVDDGGDRDGDHRRRPRGRATLLGSAMRELVPMGGMKQ